QEYYTFPAYLPLLLVAADALAFERVASRWSTVAYAMLTIVGTTAGVALIAGVWSSRNLPVPADLGSVLANRQVAENTLSRSKFFDLTGPAFAGLRLPALLAAAALLFGPLFALRRHKGSPRTAIWVLALSSTAFLIAAHIALLRFGPFMSSRVLARDIQRQLRSDDEVMIYGDQAYGSSLTFYLRRQVLLVNGRSTSLLWGSNYPDAPHLFLTDGDLLREWRSPRRVFLFVTSDRSDRVKSLLGSAAHVFAQVSGKQILSNKP
ncbi:MAG TPA: hypothetical protein VM912_08190, partial [Terriglobales bacterium]|nr:hypothetical protein [Terriglobales bacterium]